MVSFLTSFSTALLLTLIFGYRFSAMQNPKFLLFYFTLFFGLKWGGETLFLPPGAFGIEVAYICFALSAVFGGLAFLRHRFE
jgi:hypothetical protein